MKEKYLVINGGSSSLKFSLYEVENGQETEIVKGLIERIGIKGSCWTLKCNGKSVGEKEEMPNHKIALKIMLRILEQYNFIQDINEIKGVGHRVVHGGEHYSDSVIIDEDVLSNIKSVPFAPNHTPGQAAIIENMLKILPDVTQVSVFDTAFHQTMTEENATIALPYEYYDKYGIRNYGFHGTNCKYITELMKRILNKKYINIIIAHLGNGSSISAVKKSKSVFNSMGLTPSNGLIQGTRIGSVDPGIAKFICEKENMSIEECTEIFNKKSGLLGISGVSSDIRDLLVAEKEKIKNAAKALRKFEDSISKQILASLSEFEEGIDAIVFTAGIGENVASIRENVIKKLAILNVKIDKEKNENITKVKEGIISSYDSAFPIYVIPANEEIMILRDTIKLSKENIISKEKIKTKILK